MTKTTKTLPVFNNNEDYSQPSPERTCKYKLENGQVIYLTEEQRNFMLTEYWEEKRTKYRQCRCAIATQDGHLKRCPDGKDCSTCPHYLSGKKKANIISLDALCQDSDWDMQDTSVDILDEIIQNDRAKSIAQIIEQLPDPIDKLIIKRWMYERSTDTATAKIVGLSVRAVTKRRAKVFQQLKEVLKKIL